MGPALVMRRLLPAACVAVLLAAPSLACARLEVSQGFSLPTTISPQAAERLRGFYANEKATSPTRPVTLEDWDRRWRAAEAGPLALGKATLDQLKPTMSREVIGGVAVLRVRPSGWRATGRTLVYTHGGGYVSFSAASTASMAASMAAVTGDEVISIDYTVAPRGKWRAVTDEVVAVWKALLVSGVNPASVGFFGDSAGGGLAAGSILKIRDQNLPLPGALLLLSPWSDISRVGDTYGTLANADPVLWLDELGWAADAYADPADQKQPYASPVYGDYAKPFPPTLIQLGTREMLLSDAVRQYQAIRSGGHEAWLDVYEGMPHAFQYFVGDAPEGRIARARAAQFFNAHLTRVATTAP